MITPAVYRRAITLQPKNARSFVQSLVARTPPASSTGTSSTEGPSSTVSAAPGTSNDGGAAVSPELQSGTVSHPLGKVRKVGEE
ncbi:unnamed protein product [Jaminaea pallidilutea]